MSSILMETRLLSPRALLELTVLFDEPLQGPRPLTSVHTPMGIIRLVATRLPWLEEELARQPG